MTVSAFEAAKRLGERSGWSLSNLEMQKLLYLAHMFHLGQYETPLVSGHFEAWDYGPVHPDLYHRIKIFGSSPVENVFHSVNTPQEGTEAQLLDNVFKHLANQRPGRLVAITHWDKGAWARHYDPGTRSAIIPNEDILDEYQERERSFRTKQAS
jgi:uncharacterized phage-associated protein